MARHDEVTVRGGAIVLIADGRKAIIARNEGSPVAPRLTVCATHFAEKNEATHEQGTDRPGRFEKGPARRSAAEATDWHSLAEEAFLRDAAGHLERMLQDAPGCPAILVAPPAALAVLRKTLQRHAGRIEGTLAKDLTKHAMPEIEAALAAS